MPGDAKQILNMTPVSMAIGAVVRKRPCEDDNNKQRTDGMKTKHTPAVIALALGLSACSLAAQPNDAPPGGPGPGPGDGEFRPPKPPPPLVGALDADHDRKISA